MKRNLIIILLFSIAINISDAQEVEYTPRYADACYIKGVAEFNHKNYQIAKKYFDLSWEINDSILRKEPFISSNAPDWIAHILYIEGNKKEAQELSIDYCFLPIDQRETWLSDSFWVEASECSDLRQSLTLSIKARNIELSKLGLRHYYIANSDQEIAGIYMRLELWDSAKYYQEEAIDIFEEWIKHDYSQNYIITLLEYIRTSVHLNDDAIYIETVPKCKMAAKQLYGDNSVSYAYTLYEIARANIHFNDFVDCISNAKESVSLYSQFLPSREIELRLVLCFQLLGNAYGYFYDYQNARSYLQKANDLLEKDHSIADEILFDIAYYQGKCGEYDSAIATYKKLINYLEEYYLNKEKENQYYSREYLQKHSQELLTSSYLDIAEIFYHQKKIDSTIYYASTGLSVAKQYDIQTKQMEALQTLSICYFEQGKYNEAIELQEYILSNNSNNMTNVYNLMWSYYAVKNAGGFYKCATDYYSFEKEETLYSFSRLYENNRLDYLENGDFNRLRVPIRFAYYYSDDDSICCLAYNCELFRKSVLLTSSIEFSRMVSECDEETQDNYQQLLQIRERLNRPIADRNRSKLIEEEQRLEGLLLKQLPTWADNIKQLQYSWKDIQKALNGNEIAIEFAEYERSDENKIIALIIRSGWKSPRCVVLDEFDCDDYKIVNFDFSDKFLSESIWGKIITEAQISDHETVYFAADGVFRIFPIEYLPDPNNKGQTISDRFNMVRLSSTREICSPHKNDSILSIALYGNLQYDVTPEQKITNSHKYHPSRYCAMDNKRGYLIDDSVRAGYKRLYWTQSEIDSIEHFAIAYLPQISIAKYEHDKGTEESFKALSKKSTSIIHLATHAFYNKDLSHNDVYQSEGLLLSGCNTTCDDRLTVEDGILCSSEIELLDLRNTSLVVLSACNTGLGYAMVDGIGGLQRSFKKAGVGTIIMSLWEVSDAATSYFMQQFYKSLFVTKSKRKAFIQARQQTRNKFEDPYYWASFIMLD